MMKISFKLAAWCAAAGRDYNEDNFQLKDNLSNPDWGSIKTDAPVLLDEKGALLIVCDGMGGLNAGEVASDLAVKTIQEWFAAERLTPQVLATPESIMQYIEKAIIAADDKIKEDGKQNKEHEGMGSTIVLAWLVKKNVYVGWCGDSRAYRFNPAFGIEQLSHDHSYVQELVDSGKLLPELAFDHPDSNIITRSLGDNRQKARPDVKCFPLYNNDIILLCSDGLSGVLQNHEMEAILLKNTDSMENCRKALWAESEKVGWTDNVTMILCNIISGGEKPDRNIQKPTVQTKKKKRGKTTLLITIIGVVLLGIAFLIGNNFLKEKPTPILDVTPTNLQFGEVEIERTLNIANSGKDTLNYSATCAQPWVKLENATGAITTEIKTIKVTVNRSGLTTGEYSDNIIINSNSNSDTIPITMKVVGTASPTDNIVTTGNKRIGTIVDSTEKVEDKQKEIGLTPANNQ